MRGVLLWDTVNTLNKIINATLLFLPHFSWAELNYLRLFLCTQKAYFSQIWFTNLSKSVLVSTSPLPRDLHSHGSTAGLNATGCSVGQLLMGECGCRQEETFVCAGCGRIKLFAGLPQNRNYLNIKCLKHIDCYLSVAKSKRNNLY